MEKDKDSRKVRLFLIDEEFYFCYGRIVRGGTSGCRLSCEICEYKENIPVESLFLIYQDKFSGAKINLYVRGRIETLLEEHKKIIDIKKIPLLKEIVLMDFCEDGKGFKVQEKAVFPNGRFQKGNEEISPNILDARLNLEKNFENLK